MPVEQRGQVIAVDLGQPGQTGRSPKRQRKAAALDPWRVADRYAPTGI